MSDSRMSGFAAFLSHFKVKVTTFMVKNVKVKTNIVSLVLENQFSDVFKTR